MSRKEFNELAPPERAHELIAELDIRPEPDTVPLEEARDRVLAERIDASLDVPGFDRSTMDGYAVRAADTFGADEADPATLELIGAVHAGEEPSVTVEPGTAVEASTGAVLPPGADAVVMVERTAEVDGSVQIRTAVAPGDNVMVAGTDVAAGSRALGPGTRITPREIALLSALGVTEVPVRGRPTVGIISTGDELVPPGNPLNSEQGQIYDVNGGTLAAAVAEAGGNPVRYPHVGDDHAEMEDTLATAGAECDLVLTSGSTSAGAVDVVYRVIEEQGELLLHGVAVKPGKPMLIGRIADAGYVGLPGYPVSALTIFRTFVAPAIRRAAGLPEPRTGTVEGSMGVRERYSEGRLRFMPVGLVEDEAGETLVYPVDKGSGATTSLVDADGFVEVPPENEFLEVGDPVTVQLFSPDVRTPTLFGVGEDDPALSRLLDRLERPRYLPVGSREGLRRLRDGLPDLAVVAGPTEREVDTTPLGGWVREWGLVVPADNPDSVAGVADLIDRDLRFVNRETNSGLRRSLDRTLADLATERDTDRETLTAAIDGYELTTKAHESPARRVLAGKADVGVGLRATATKLGLGFVSLGDQRVELRANPERTGKPSIHTLDDLLDDFDAIVTDLDGIRADD
ncbi:MAG: molybdopterin biosynthesis protein [Halobacteriales archaeon]|nr:molybdopterin biosynthesis protein [Halobacteriales archaeon]